MHFLILTLLITYTIGIYGQETPRPPNFIGKTGGVEISKAQPEDITPENYPDIIDSFVFPNVALKDVIKTMSTDLNINIIMKPGLGDQKISIISYSPITVAEAYQAFLSALSIHGLTVVRSGSFLKVIETKEALKSNVRVYTGNKKVNADQFITSIIKLKHIDAGSLEAKMKPFIDDKAVASLIFYPPSNTVIISDYGSNVERIKKIINHLDIPSKDFIFKVFSIKHAQAAHLKETINNLLRVGRHSTARAWRLKTTSGTNRQSINISALSHDERTNSIIVMGNQAGINKVKELIQQLDYYKDPELAGGIYVYKVKHGTATELAKTLNELINSKNTGTKKKNLPRVTQPSIPKTSFFLQNLKSVETAQSFQDVRIIAEVNTNSLLIVSNKYNYENILNILKKVDISRNQVFVKAIIMELNTERSNDWQIANYFFPKEGGGVSRIGYGLSKLTDIASTEGATLFFPLSLFKPISSAFGIAPDSTTDVSNWLRLNDSAATQLPSSGINIPSLSSLIKFLQKTVGANILSTPQVMALDHQQATVSITEKIPVLGERTTQTALAQATTSINNVEVETSLVITPHINPNVNSIRLKIEQKIDNIFKTTAVPEALQKTNVAVKKRVIRTFITLKDKETAVLGGLIKETSSKTNSKVPFLGDLPLIGWLFKNSTTDREKSNLVVFITPHIIRSSEEHKDILSNKLKERMSFIRQFTGDDDPYKDITEQMLNQQQNDLTDDLSSRPDNTPSFENNREPPTYEDIQDTEEIQEAPKEPPEEEGVVYQDEDDFYQDESLNPVNRNENEDSPVDDYYKDNKSVESPTDEAPYSPSINNYYKDNISLPAEEDDDNNNEDTIKEESGEEVMDSLTPSESM